MNNGLAFLPSLSFHLFIPYLYQMGRIILYRNRPALLRLVPEPEVGHCDTRTGPGTERCQYHRGVANRAHHSTVPVPVSRISASCRCRCSAQYSTTYLL